MRIARLSLFNRLPFTSAPAAPYTLSGQEVTRWFNGLPHDQPQAVCDNLVKRISEIRKSGANHRRQFKHLERLLANAEASIKQFERMLDQAKLPLDASTKLAASCTDRLLKHFAEAYLDLAKTMGGGWMRLINRGAHGQATLRATQLVHRRALAAHRLYTGGSARRWAQFSELLAIAREYGFEDKTVDAHSQETVERVIVQAGLIALADPTSMDSQEFARVRFYVERFGDHAKLRNTAPRPGERGAGVFLLGESPNGPKRLSSEHRLRSNESVLDCRPLLKKLQRQITGLRKGVAPARLGLPVLASEGPYLFLLNRCMEQWSEPRTRKDAREVTRPRADLVSGFNSVRAFLGASALKRRRSDSGEGGAGNGLSVSSEWAITDQSASGFGLKWISGHNAAIAVGEVVALRPREAATVYICVARRARSMSNNDIEVGLEILSEVGVPTTITKPVAKGPAVSVPVLLLPKVQRLGGGPGMIAPIGDVSDGLAVTVPNRGQMIELEAAGTVERLASCELLQLKKSQAS